MENVQWEEEQGRGRGRKGQEKGVEAKNAEFCNKEKEGARRRGEWGKKE